MLFGPGVISKLRERICLPNIYVFATGVLIRHLESSAKPRPAPPLLAFLGGGKGGSHEWYSHKVRIVTTP